MKQFYVAMVAAGLLLPGLASAQTYTYSTLVNFPSSNGPLGPNTPLTIDNSGNLYGTSEEGGTFGVGTVFEVTSKGVLTTLYNFGTNNSESFLEGAYPVDNLVREKSTGNLYGVTATNYDGNCFDGDFACGVIFEVTSTGKESTVYDLPYCGQGSFPYGGVNLDSAGDVYGEYYCAVGNGYDKVFKMTTAGKVTTYAFLGYNVVSSALITNSAGNLYGYGEANSTSPYSIIKITPSTGKLTTVYTFASGITPSGKLTQDTAGNFYGTTSNGGTNGSGTLFKYSTKEIYSVLYNFGSQSECTDGVTPLGWLTLDSSGNLYGLTSGGGTGGCTDGNGVIFKVTSSGKESVLYDFTCSPSNDFSGGTTLGLVEDASGNFYGASSCVGDNGTGSVYKLTKN
jgi:uncharacterized repeat protein (TIGR03803 family)